MSVLAVERMWLQALCDKYRADWEGAIALEKEESPGTDEKEVQKLIAENAAQEVERMERELDRMLVRTSVIVAATTLLFAVYAFKASVGFGVILATIAFITALVPMCPPIYRAWREAYVPRHAWTLLATSQYKRWVLNCWLTDRRTRIVTRYKRAHAIAIPVLAAATCVTGAILTVGFLK